MNDFRIGAVDVPVRVDRERYFDALDYLELSALFAGPQKPSALAKWAAIAPAGSIGLVAPFALTHRRAPAHPRPWPTDASSGEFRDSAPARAAVDALVDAVMLLHPRCVVFRSPEDFSPSATHRERLAQFFAEIAPGARLGVERVWLPGGLWGVRTAAKVAADIGVTLAFDPLVRDPNAPEERYEQLDAPALYFRIDNAGRSGPLRAEKLEDLAELVEHYQDRRLTVAFASPERWHDARNFKKLVAGES